MKRQRSNTEPEAALFAITLHEELDNAFHLRDATAAVKGLKIVTKEDAEAAWTQLEALDCLRRAAEATLEKFGGSEVGNYIEGCIRDSRLDNLRTFIWLRGLQLGAWRSLYAAADGAKIAFVDPGPDSGFVRVRGCVSVGVRLHPFRASPILWPLTGVPFNKGDDRWVKLSWTTLVPPTPPRTPSPTTTTVVMKVVTIEEGLGLEMSDYEKDNDYCPTSPSPPGWVGRYETIENEYHKKVDWETSADDEDNGVRVLKTPQWCLFDIRVRHDTTETGPSLSKALEQWINAFGAAGLHLANIRFLAVKGNIASEWENTSDSNVIDVEYFVKWATSGAGAGVGAGAVDVEEGESQ